MWDVSKDLRSSFVRLKNFNVEKSPGKPATSRLGEGGLGLTVSADVAIYIRPLKKKTFITKKNKQSGLGGAGLGRVGGRCDLHSSVKKSPR